MQPELDPVPSHLLVPRPQVGLVPRGGYHLWPKQEEKTKRPWRTRQPIPGQDRANAGGAVPTPPSEERQRQMQLEIDRKLDAERKAIS